VPSGFLDRFNSCCFSRCSLDSRSCFVSAQAPGGAYQALGACSSGCYAVCQENRQPAALAPWPWCAETASSREVGSGGGCFCRSSLHGSSSNLTVLVVMQIPVTPGDSRGSSSGCMFDAQQFDELPN
jgi:hypothetical protein